MAARTGVAHHRSGPHLPVGAGVIRSDEGFADPAKGAAIPRCLTCGMPARGGFELATFELVPTRPLSWIGRLLEALQAPRLYYRLCAECVLHANRIGPRETDPLDVLQTA